MTRRFYCAGWNEDKANELAAVLASHSPAGLVLDRLAEKVSARAKAKIAPHYKSGETEKAIKPGRKLTRKGVLDRHVFIERDFLMHIETGHFMGAVGLPNRPWIKGLHFIKRAARSVDRQLHINRRR